MALENISMGPPPDFLLKKGQRIFYHFASIKVYNQEGVGPTITFSHASLVNLIKEIMERGLAFGTEKAEGVTWVRLGEIEVKLASLNRMIRINYKINPSLSKRDKQVLSLEFERRLKGFLRVQHCRTPEV